MAHTNHVCGKAGEVMEGIRVNLVSDGIVFVGVPLNQCNGCAWWSTSGPDARLLIACARLLGVGGTFEHFPGELSPNALRIPFAGLPYAKTA